MSRYHHLSPAYDSTDDALGWLLALPDAELADYARYRLPDELLAKLARAYFPNVADEYREGILADSREAYDDAARTGAEE
ncbi:hypothetical protein [Noviluteimonas gilva]|uniref:Uncharacterized protein n=1 Tax=Noviluteimonas gilva TaxID=2682097 RepID=A0A7C9HUB9_9GAMM|nr:hypothetical protein [Lysobacter gilvus]MUV13538.1 hypothetical protein [Lysobacter gilvus]